MKTWESVSHTYTTVNNIDVNPTSLPIIARCNAGTTGWPTDKAGGNAGYCLTVSITNNYAAQYCFSFGQKIAVRRRLNSDSWGGGETFAPLNYFDDVTTASFGKSGVPNTGGIYFTVNMATRPIAFNTKSLSVLFNSNGIYLYDNTNNAFLKSVAGTS